MTHTPRIERAIRSVSRRVRMKRALDAGSIGITVGWGVAIGVILLSRWGVVDAAWEKPTLIGTFLFGGLFALAAFLRPTSRLAAAHFLDRSHDLRSRIASAVEFDALRADERSSFMQAAIDDAERASTSLDPRRAFPLRKPRALPWMGAFGLGLVVALAVEPPSPLVAARLPPPAPPALLHADDLHALRAPERDDARDPEEAEEVRRLAGELNRLLEKLAERDLDRTDALREVAALEQKIEDARAGDAEAMRERWKELGGDLARAGLVQAASDALKRADPEGAAEAMKSLANALREGNPSRAEIEKLRQALERAADRAAEDGRQSEALDARREELEKRIASARERAEEDEGERRLLRRREKELEQLDRQRERIERRRRHLERLSRDWQDAAQGLERRAPQDAADALERSAEDLSRMAQGEKSERERQELARKLEQLRELLRRNGRGPSNEGREQRLDRFVQRARGQGENAGSESGGESRRPGGPGAGPPQGTGAMTGAAIAERGSGRGDGDGEGDGDPSGTEAGRGHDARTLDRSTSLEGKTQDVRAQTAQGRGPSRSEVILGAADRGFVTRPYRSVYRDYRDHAEEVLERDEIPDGYRFYVRRYFQLIRPREEP